MPWLAAKIKVVAFLYNLGIFPLTRIGRLHPCWCWQMRFECAKNVNKATDKMMQACGGSGYKRDLGKSTQTQVGFPVEVLLSRSV